MAFYRCGGGGIPSSLKTDMNAVLNKKFGTSSDYPPADWAPTVNLMGPLPEKTIVSSPIADFSDGADDVPTKSLVVTISPTLSGKSEVTETQTGRNLLNPTYLEDGYSLGADGLPMLVAKRIATTTPVPIHGGNITISYSTSVNTVQFMYATFANGTLIERVAGKTNGRTINAQNADEIYISLYDTQSTDITGGSVVTNIQLEYGSTAHAYEPYQTPTQYTASLGRTIYGGQVDIVNGTAEPTNWLDVPERAEMTRNGIVSSVSSDGTITASGQSTGNGDIPITLGTSVNLKGGETYTFSIIGTDTRSGSVYVYFAGGSYISISNANHSGTYTPSADQTITGVTLRMFNTQTITLSAKVQLEKGSTVHDYSPYFEPFTFTGQEVPTRLGYNAFWSDEGDTEVTYRADINLALGGQ